MKTEMLPNRRAERFFSVLLDSILVLTSGSKKLKDSGVFESNRFNSSQEERPPVPSDSVQVPVPGCLFFHNNIFPS